MSATSAGNAAPSPRANGAVRSRARTQAASADLSAGDAEANFAVPIFRASSCGMGAAGASAGHGHCASVAQHAWTPVDKMMDVFSNCWHKATQIAKYDTVMRWGRATAGGGDNDHAARSGSGPAGA